MLPLSFLVFWWSIILFLCELFKVLRLILYFCFFTFIYFSFPCAVLKVKDCIFYCTIWIICVHNCMLLLFSVSWFIQGRCTCTLCLRTLQCALVEFVWTHNPIFFCIKKKTNNFLMQEHKSTEKWIEFTGLPCYISHLHYVIGFGGMNLLACNYTLVKWDLSPLKLIFSKVLACNFLKISEMTFCSII